MAAGLCLVFPAFLDTNFPQMFRDYKVYAPLCVSESPRAGGRTGRGWERPISPRGVGPPGAVSGPSAPGPSLWARTRGGSWAQAGAGAGVLPGVTVAATPGPASPGPIHLCKRRACPELPEGPSQEASGGRASLSLRFSAGHTHLLCARRAPEVVPCAGRHFCLCLQIYP